MHTFLLRAEWKAGTSSPPNLWSLSHFWVSLLQNQKQDAQLGWQQPSTSCCRNPRWSRSVVLHSMCACKNTVSHPATSGISSYLLAHLGKLRVTELPPPKPRDEIFLWYCEQEEVAPLWLVYPESADQHWIIQWWWCRREQKTPSSERSSWTNLLLSVPLIKSLWGNTSVFIESKWCKQRYCSFPCGHVCDAITIHSEWPGLSDS